MNETIEIRTKCRNSWNTELITKINQLISSGHSNQIKSTICANTSGSIFFFFGMDYIYLSCTFLYLTKDKSRLRYNRSKSVNSLPNKQSTWKYFRVERNLLLSYFLWKQSMSSGVILGVKPFIYCHIAMTVVGKKGFFCGLFFQSSSVIP